MTLSHINFDLNFSAISALIHLIKMESEPILAIIYLQKNGPLLEDLKTFQLGI